MYNVNLMKESKMSNKTVLLAAVMGLMITGGARAEDGKLGVTFDLTYASKWLSKGVEGYGQKGALFKTIDIDWYGTGFGVKVVHRNSTSRGYVDKQRFDFRPYYKSKLFEDTTWATNYNLSVGYEYYPGLARHKSNTTYEWIFAFNWPNILPAGITPCYTAHYEYPAQSGEAFNHITGWVHRFGLFSDVHIDDLPNALRLSSEVAYTDGLGGASHDWSYATFGLSTVLKLSENASFVPGIYQQVSMDDSVNKRKDVTYTMLSFKYAF
jgi:hypothetical protein